MSDDSLVVDPMKCGMGHGEACCAFLAGTPGRFICGRTSKFIALVVRERIEDGTMVAKYDPGETPYPECQPFPLS